MAGAVAVITFPGSNGDHDAFHSLSVNMGVPTELVDYRRDDISDFDALVIPGGFSYGDHLRCGAIARFAPVMESVRQFADRGGPVIGICNGFQILTEAHLLPGALLRNQSLRFACEWVHVRAEHPAGFWMSELKAGDVLRLPIAHGDGSYFADEQTTQQLEKKGLIFLRYCNEHGEVGEVNPNGSLNAIAGIRNATGNVVAMMPHPERATDALVGGDDGRRILSALYAITGVPA